MKITHSFVLLASFFLVNNLYAQYELLTFNPIQNRIYDFNVTDPIIMNYQNPYSNMDYIVFQAPKNNGFLINSIVYNLPGETRYFTYAFDPQSFNYDLVTFEQLFSWTDTTQLVYDVNDLVISRDLKTGYTGSVYTSLNYFYHLNQLLDSITIMAYANYSHFIKKYYHAANGNIDSVILKTLGTRQKVARSSYYYSGQQLDSIVSSYANGSPSKAEFHYSSGLLSSETITRFDGSYIQTHYSYNNDGSYLSTQSKTYNYLGITNDSIEVELEFKYNLYNNYQKIITHLKTSSYSGFGEYVFDYQQTTFGLNEFESVHLAVCPNPAMVGDAINIFCNQDFDSKPLEVELYQTNGMIVYKTSLRGDELLNLPKSLKSGKYILIIKTGQNNFKTKLLVN